MAYKLVSSALQGYADMLRKEYKDGKMGIGAIECAFGKAIEHKEYRGGGPTQGMKIQWEYGAYRSSGPTKALARTNNSTATGDSWTILPEDIYTRKYYASFAVDRIKADFDAAGMSDGSKNALILPHQREFMGLKQSVWTDVNRALMGDGSGYICQLTGQAVTDGSTAVTYDVADGTVYGLQKGQYVDVYSTAGVRRGDPTAATPYVWRVESVKYNMGGTSTVTLICVNADTDVPVSAAVLNTLAPVGGGGAGTGRLCVGATSGASDKLYIMHMKDLMPIGFKDYFSTSLITSSTTLFGKDISVMPDFNQTRKYARVGTKENTLRHALQNHRLHYQQFAANKPAQMFLVMEPYTHLQLVNEIADRREILEIDNGMTLQLGRDVWNLKLPNAPTIRIIVDPFCPPDVAWLCERSTLEVIRKPGDPLVHAITNGNAGDAAVRLNDDDGHELMLNAVFRGFISFPGLNAVIQLT